MLRRLFLLGSAVPPPASERLPNDPLELNAFAETYNKYIVSLQEGILDVRLWRRVRAAWERLTN